MQIVNLFKQLYNVPVYNGCYGIAGYDGIGQRQCTLHVLDRAVRAARRRGALQLALSDLSRTCRRSLSDSTIR